MKAAIYAGKEQIELKELPLPEVGEHDVLIQNIYSSVCGTDTAVFFGGPGRPRTSTAGWTRRALRPFWRIFSAWARSKAGL